MKIKRVALKPTITNEGLKVNYLNEDSKGDVVTIQYSNVTNSVTITGSTLYKGKHCDLYKCKSDIVHFSFGTTKEFDSIVAQNSEGETVIDFAYITKTFEALENFKKIVEDELNEEG